MTDLIPLLLARQAAGDASFGGHVGNVLFLLVLALVAIAVIIWWLRRQA